MIFPQSRLPELHSQSEITVIKIQLSIMLIRFLINAPAVENVYLYVHRNALLPIRYPMSLHRNIVFIVEIVSMTVLSMQYCIMKAGQIYNCPASF